MPKNLLWKAEDISIDNVPCFKCKKYQKTICTINCEDLIKYLKSTEIPDFQGYKSKSYNAGRKNHNPESVEDDDSDQYEDTSDYRIIDTTQGDHQDDKEGESSKEKLLAYFVSILLEGKIFKHYEKTLREQFISFLECMKIVELANLSGESKQNMAKKISRRINKLRAYLIRMHDGISGINEALEKELTTEDIATPYYFKRVLNLTTDY